MKTLSFETLEFSVDSEGLTTLSLRTHEGLASLTLTSFELEMLTAELTNHKHDVKRVRLTLHQQDKLKKELRR